MTRNVLVFGAIAGVIVSAFMATSMAIMGCSGANEKSMMTGMVIGFASMFVAFSFVFVGMINYREKVNGGRLPFWKGVLLGLLISIVASTMYVITWGIEFHYFLPDFMEKYSALQIQEVKASGLTPEIITAKIKEIEDTRYAYEHNIFVFAAYTYSEILPVGIIVTFISALILMWKKRRIVVQNQN